MQYLKIESPIFIHKISMWVYIKYFLLNQLLYYLPNTDMEWIV